MVADGVEDAVLDEDTGALVDDLVLAEAGVEGRVGFDSDVGHGPGLHTAHPLVSVGARPCAPQGIQLALVGELVLCAFVQGAPGELSEWGGGFSVGLDLGMSDLS